MRNNLPLMLTICFLAFGTMAQADTTIDAKGVVVTCGGGDALQIVDHQGRGLVYRSSSYERSDDCDFDAKVLTLKVQAAQKNGMPLTISDAYWPSNALKIELAGKDLVVSPKDLYAECGGRSQDNLIVYQNGSMIYLSSRYSGIASCRADASEVNGIISTATAARKLLSLKFSDAPTKDFSVSKVQE